jgi:hypothetical protein
MAVDTREKRASIIGLGLAAALVLPTPDASVVLQDRQQVAFAYAGIDAGEPPPAEFAQSFRLYGGVSTSIRV